MDLDDSGREKAEEAACKQEAARASELLVSAALEESRPEKPRPGREIIRDARMIATTNGVTLNITADSLEYKLPVDGKEVLLVRVDWTKEGIETARKAIDEARDRKAAEITSRYKVQFGREDEQPDRQYIIKEDGSFERGEPIRSRNPLLPELYGIEAALAHSEPAYFGKDGKTPLKFYFLKDSYVKGDVEGVVAHYINKDWQGRPAVLIAPNSTDFRPITEADLAAAGIVGEYSIESLLVHEMAHNTQFNLDWDLSENLEKVSSAMGWAPFEHPETKETRWLIRARPDELYEIEPGSTVWIRRNEKGQALDAKGDVVAEAKDAFRLETHELRDRALVRPPTEYFDNAVEMAAEALMLFRLGGEQRLYLLRESPVLYAFIKSQDQAEIDRLKGVGPDGKPLLIRGKEGGLVANTAENRAIIASFEGGGTGK